MAGTAHRRRPPGAVAVKWQHINPYGTFALNMKERLPLELVTAYLGATLPKFRPSLG
jgi:hypothetical protein